MFNGERLRELRKTRKLTSKQFGEKFNLAESTISGYETGNRVPDTQKINDFANYFGVSADYLIGRTDVPETSKPYYALTEKNERDIAKDLERMMGDLESGEGLAFHGEPMTDQDRELLRLSLDNAMRLAKEMAKKKFTPKKYRD